MALFARAKEPFLRKFLTLQNGLPSHDTFSRLFDCWIPNSFAPLSSDLWRVSGRSKALSPLMARFCVRRVWARVGQ
jgi:hypothetical protein